MVFETVIFVYQAYFKGDLPVLKATSKRLIAHTFH